MSGIEVTGLVLGAFPLLISALKRYAEGLETIKHWRQYKRSSAHLAIILDAEWGRFQGTAEKLLDGLVPAAELDNLIQDPDNLLWKSKDLNRKLKHRLDRDHGRYFRCVAAMQEAVNDFWSRLELDKYGRPQWGDFYSFKHQYKRIRLTLSRRKDCHCDYLHEAGLRLDARLDSECRDELSSIQVCYSTHVRNQRRSQWYEFEIRALRTEELESQQPRVLEKGHKKKRVKFLEIFDLGDSAQQTSLIRSSRYLPPVDNVSAAKIEYMCYETQRLERLMSSRSSGSVSGKLLGVLRQEDISKTRFGVFVTGVSHHGHDRTRIFRSLTALLKGGDNKSGDLLRLTLGNLTLGHGQRLILALTLASTVLQLPGTQWLNRCWDKSCIMLDIAQSRNKLEHPPMFIKRLFPEEPEEEPEKQQLAQLIILNPVIYNLGVLLIEICLGRALESFRTKEDPLDKNRQPDILTDVSTARRLIDDVYLAAGTGYGDVVRRCIRNDFDTRHIHLNDDSFRQTFYEKVVEPLGEDVKNFYRLD